MQIKGCAATVKAGKLATIFSRWLIILEQENMFAERILVPQKDPIESYDSIFGDDLQSYIDAISYAHQFRGLSKDEIYQKVRSVAIPDRDKVFRVENGFNVDRQTALYLHLFNQMVPEGSTIEDVNAIFARITLQDLEGYNFEFINRNSVLINWLRRDEKNIRAYRYNDVPLTEVASATERDGIYIEVLKELTEKVTKADPNSTFVITSPAGWAGTNDKGEELVFPETQTYIYRVDENGELKAITIRTDLDLEDNECLMQILSKNDFNPLDELSEKERLKHVSRYVADCGDMTFEEVVQALQKASGKTYAWTDGGRKKVTFKELIDQVDNIHSLYSLDSSVQQILDNFKYEMINFGTVTSDEDLQRLVKLLGQTALQISHAYRTKSSNRNTHYEYNPFPHIDYQSESKYVSEQPGCMAVSRTATWQNTALGMRLVQTAETETDFDVLSGAYFRCPGCNGKIKSGEGTTTCPHCGMTKEQAGNPCPV